MPRLTGTLHVSDKETGLHRGPFDGITRNGFYQKTELKVMWGEKGDGILGRPTYRSDKKSVPFGISPKSLKVERSEAR